MMRFIVIAAERAPTIATMIHNICRHDGQPGNAPGIVVIARRKQRARQRERQREYGVLELDHFENRADAARAHRQNPGVSTQSSQSTQRKA